MTMHLLIMYDITDDRIRTKVAKELEDYGLDRIQYSAFYGQLNRNLQEELMMALNDLLNDAPARIQLIPIAANDWEKRLEVGHGYAI
jgi:CRISPR-associated protein Cas2